MTRALLTRALILGILGLCAAAPVTAQQPGSILIWPVNPVIEADARAGALWLENPGKTPITLQVRVFSWAQAEAKNVYAPQDEILGTPPIVTIQPGAKQLVRLTRAAAPPTEAEKPYRVIVDEIPVAGAAPGNDAGAAVSFRMRYSIPLFSYAADAGPQATKKAKRASPSPTLAWRVESDADGRFLEIRNTGPVHARLVDVAFQGGALPKGLFGYVLPGAAMRWPLPADIHPDGELIAAINGAAPAPVARQAP